jgi:hypothetical protein
MDAYTLGKLALPFVAAIMAFSAVLTMVMGIFTLVKTLTGVQQLFHTLEENRRTALTVHIHNERKDSQPLMRKQD